MYANPGLLSNVWIIAALKGRSLDERTLTHTKASTKTGHKMAGCLAKEVHKNGRTNRYG